MCRIVVLPAPLGPSRPVIPGPRANVMSLTATTGPYQRDTRSRTIGAVGAPAVASADGSGANVGTVMPTPSRHDRDRDRGFHTEIVWKRRTQITIDPTIPTAAAAK